MTPFEEQLKQYFPEIYALHELSKAEPHIWEVVSEILKMRAEDVTGMLRIHYNRGHIDEIIKEQKTLTDKASRPGY